MRSRPAAVIFDCDGLLLETESRWQLAEARVLAAHGVQLTPALSQKLLGRGLTDAGQILAHEVGLGAENAQSLGEQLSAEFGRALKRDGVNPMPGAVELLRELEQKEIPIGLASNTNRAHVIQATTIANVKRYFGVISCAGDGLLPKPEPDVYLNACTKLAVAPAAAIALEDSAVGVAAAKAAGLTVIGVPSVPGAQLDADVQLDSLTKINVETLTHLAPQMRR